jgi:hypothetical protein
MTSKSATGGFAFDKTKPLSNNLQRFFIPAKGTGRERRFHAFLPRRGPYTGSGRRDAHGGCEGTD